MLHLTLTFVCLKFVKTDKVYDSEVTYVLENVIFLNSTIEMKYKEKINELIYMYVSMYIRKNVKIERFVKI